MLPIAGQTAGRHGWPGGVKGLKNYNFLFLNLFFEIIKKNLNFFLPRATPGPSASNL